MGIFSVSHIIIIFLVALIVFGPEKLPELARQMGKLMGDFRRVTTDLRGTLEEHMRELERETQAIQPHTTPAANPPEQTIQQRPPAALPEQTAPAASESAAGSESGSAEPEKLSDGDAKPA